MPSARISPSTLPAVSPAEPTAPWISPASSTFPSAARSISSGTSPGTARQRGFGFFDEPGVFDEDFGDPDQTRDFARDLHRVRELAGELAQTRNRARTCAYDCGLDLGLACDLDEFVLRAADLAADLAGHLSLYLDRARALARNLGTQKVDASGADLSHADIHGVEVLGGVIWTVQTTWPPGMAAGIRSQSREIRPGVYQVIQGNHPDRAALVPA